MLFSHQIWKHKKTYGYPYLSIPWLKLSAEGKIGRVLSGVLIRDGRLGRLRSGTQHHRG